MGEIARMGFAVGISVGALMPAQAMHEIEIFRGPAAIESMQLGSTPSEIRVGSMVLQFVDRMPEKDTPVQTITDQNVRTIYDGLVAYYQKQDSDFVKPDLTLLDSSKTAVCYAESGKKISTKGTDFRGLFCLEGPDHTPEVFLNKQSYPIDAKNLTAQQRSAGIVAIRTSLGHELGHDRQYLVETPSKYPVEAIEYQADCYAGQAIKAVAPSSVAAAKKFLGTLPAGKSATKKNRELLAKREAAFQQGASGKSCDISVFGVAMPVVTLED
jgi:hypothetical protein